MAAATVAIHKARQRAAENGEEEETAAEKRKHTRQAMTEPAPRPTTPGKLNIGDLSRGEDIPSGPRGSNHDPPLALARLVFGPLTSQTAWTR